MLEYSGQYTLSDYLQANRIHYRRSRLMIAMFVLFLLLAIVNAVQVVTHPTSIAAWVLLAVTIVFLGYPYTLLPIIVRSSYAQQLQMHGRVKITIRPDRITESSATGVSALFWLHHVLVSERTILLYTTPQTFVMLPRRFFKDDRDFEAAKNLLEAFPKGEKGYVAMRLASAPAHPLDDQSPLGHGETSSTSMPIPPAPWPPQPASQTPFERNSLAALKILGAILGVLLATAGFFFLVAGCATLGDDTSKLTSHIIFTVMLGGVPFAVGLALAVFSIRSLSRDRANSTTVTVTGSPPAPGISKNTDSRIGS